MKKKLSYLVTGILIVALLAGCGADSSSPTNGDNVNDAQSTDNVPANVSDQSTGQLTELMLYGIYLNQYFGSTNQVDERINQSLENLRFQDRDKYPGEENPYTESLSVVPIRTEAHTAIDYFTGAGSYEFAAETEWQRLYEELVKAAPGQQDQYLANMRSLYRTSCISMTYAAEDSSPANLNVNYTYTLEGDTLHCRRFKDIRDDFTIEYYEPDIREDYKVSFRDDSLVIEKDGCKSTLMTFDRQNDLDKSEEEYSDYIGGSVDKPEHAYQNAWHISASWEGSRTDADHAYVFFTDGSQAYDARAVWTEPNTMTISWDQIWNNKDQKEDSPGSMTFQCLRSTRDGSTGLIIIDDSGKVYPYIYNDKAYLSNVVSDNIDESVSLDSMDEETKNHIIADQNNVITVLQDSLDEGNIKAGIDDRTGTIRFDSNILFEVDSADLSDAGKKDLDEFLKAYIPVMEDQAKKGNVARVQVDGHTDTSGDHDYNQTLSEKRAQSVTSYIVEGYPEIEPYILAKGYSFDKPIFNDDGTVNMDASRRVEFRFILKTD